MLHFISQKFWCFFSHRPFLRCSTLHITLFPLPEVHFFPVTIFERPFLTLNPTISHFISLKFWWPFFRSPPSMHTHMLFFTFLHLALCSRNNKYCIRHLFLLNSSLHKQPFITAHFRSSLHTKTSPDKNYAHLNVLIDHQTLIIFTPL